MGFWSAGSGDSDEAFPRISGSLFSDPDVLERTESLGEGIRLGAFEPAAKPACHVDRRSGLFIEILQRRLYAALQPDFLDTDRAGAIPCFPALALGGTLVGWCRFYLGMLSRAEENGRLHRFCRSHPLRRRGESERDRSVLVSHVDTGLLPDGQRPTMAAFSLRARVSTWGAITLLHLHRSHRLSESAGCAVFDGCMLLGLLI